MFVDNKPFINLTSKSRIPKCLNIDTLHRLTITHQNPNFNTILIPTLSQLIQF